MLVLSLFLILVSVYFIGINYAIWYYRLAKGEYHSQCPLVGGLAGALAFRCAPYAVLHALWWIPLALDPGSLLTFGAIPIVLPYRLYQRKRLQMRGDGSDEAG